MYVITVIPRPCCRRAPLLPRSLALGRRCVTRRCPALALTARSDAMAVREHPCPAALRVSTMAAVVTAPAFDAALQIPGGVRVALAPSVVRVQQRSPSGACRGKAGGGKACGGQQSARRVRTCSPDVLTQLSLAPLMADHVIGVHECLQFDVPLKMGGCVIVCACRAGRRAESDGCCRRLLGRLQGVVSFLVGDSESTLTLTHTQIIIIIIASCIG